MSAADIIELISAAIAAIGALVQAGVPKATVLAHIKRIETEARQMDLDIDAIAGGK